MWWGWWLWYFENHYRNLVEVIIIKSFDRWGENYFIHYVRLAAQSVTWWVKKSMHAFVSFSVECDAPDHCLVPSPLIFVRPGNHLDCLSLFTNTRRKFGDWRRFAAAVKTRLFLDAVFFFGNYALGISFTGKLATTFVCCLHVILKMEEENIKWVIDTNQIPPV